MQVELGREIAVTAPATYGRADLPRLGVAVYQMRRGLFPSCPRLGWRSTGAAGGPWGRPACSSMPLYAAPCIAAAVSTRNSSLLSLLRNQQVGGSSPPVGSSNFKHLRASPGAPPGRLAATRQQPGSMRGPGLAHGSGPGRRDWPVNPCPPCPGNIQLPPREHGESSNAVGRQEFIADSLRGAAHRS